MARAVGLCGITQVQLAYLECERFNDRTLWFLYCPKQKDSSAVESKVYPLLGSALDQRQCNLAAKST